MRKQILKIGVSLVLMSLVAGALFMAFGVNPILTFSALFIGGAIKGLIGSTESNGLAYSGFVISDTTYAGEAASTFIVKAITSNETVQGGHIYVKDGIKKKFTIPRWDADYEDFIQARAATPTSQGTMTVTGKVLDPADYMVYTEFNPRDYEEHWFATQLQPTLIDRSLPATVESTTIQEVLKRHNRYLNKAIWNSSIATGTANLYNFYDGLIQKAEDATGGSDDTNVVTTPLTLSAVNIQAELLRGWNLIPAALRYDPKMKIFMNYETYDFYMASQIAQTYKGEDITMGGVARFKGMQVVKINDFPADCYFIAKGDASMESNLWLGLNSTQDATLELKQLQANSELWFIKMLMKVDVQIGWNSETVLYGTL